MTAPGVHKHQKTLLVEVELKANVSSAGVVQKLFKKGRFKFEDGRVIQHYDGSLEQKSFVVAETDLRRTPTVGNRRSRFTQRLGFFKTGVSTITSSVVRFENMQTRRMEAFG